MIGRIPGAQLVQTTGTVSGANAYRNTDTPSIDTNALTVRGATFEFPPGEATSVAQGRLLLNGATAHSPSLSSAPSAATQRLDRPHVPRGERIWVGGHWFYVAGTLKPAVLASAIDSSVLVGYAAAEKYLGFDSHPSTVYLRAQEHDRANAVDNLLLPPPTSENPSEVHRQPTFLFRPWFAQADAKRPQRPVPRPSCRRSAGPARPESPTS